MLTFEIIASFNNHEQDIFEIDINKEYVDEKQFITSL